MSFHSSIVRARLKAGLMALRTWLSANRNSRQGLWSLWRYQVVSSGGNGAGMTDQLVRQQRHEEFSVEPGAGACVVMLGQVAQLRQGLEAFGDRFDLPSQAVPFQNLVGG